MSHSPCSECPWSSTDQRLRPHVLASRAVNTSEVPAPSDNPESTPPVASSVRKQLWRWTRKAWNVFGMIGGFLGSVVGGIELLKWLLGG